MTKTAVWKNVKIPRETSIDAQEWRGFVMLSASDHHIWASVLVPPDAKGVVPFDNDAIISVEYAADGKPVYTIKSK